MASNSSESMFGTLISTTKDIMKPEPQFSTILRYLAMHYHQKLDKESALVYFTNSHGVQLRNDVNYWTDRRDELTEDNAEKGGPVLNCSDLNIFENFNDVRAKIRVLPDEWTVIQITKQYSPLDILEHAKDQSDNGIIITRFSCGKLAERVQPYYVSVKSKNHKDENFMQCFRDLFKIRNEFFASGGFCSKLKSEYISTDYKLSRLLDELENHWLKEWKCLFGGRLEDKNLENETYLQVQKSLDNFKKSDKKMKMYSEESLNMVYQLTLMIHFLKPNEIIKVLNYALETDGNDNFVKLIEDLKEINSRNSCAVRFAGKLPVILIIDKEFEIIPWEMLLPLTEQPVTRILSLHLLYALYKYHEAHIVGGYRIVKISSAFCVINPNKDLKDCEKEITNFLKENAPWIESVVGEVPDTKLLVSKLQECDLFFFCGHGSGRQFIKARILKKLFVKGLVLLYGCSSNIPKTAGGRTPYLNDAYTYLTNGCPCQIGYIFDVGSSDADAACKKMLENFLPFLIEFGVMKPPKQPDVLKCVLIGKIYSMKYWSKCSIVARGLPCKTASGNVPDMMKLRYLKKS